MIKLIVSGLTFLAGAVGIYHYHRKPELTHHLDLDWAQVELLVNNISMRDTERSWRLPVFFGDSLFAKRMWQTEIASSLDHSLNKIMGRSVQISSYVDGLSIEGNLRLLQLLKLLAQERSPRSAQVAEFILSCEQEPKTIFELRALRCLVQLKIPTSTGDICKL